MSDEIKIEVPKAEEEVYFFIRFFQEDKKFFTENEDLQKWLMLKHREIPKTQESLMHLVRLEIENNWKNEIKKK